MKNKIAVIAGLAMSAAFTLAAQDAPPRGGGQGFGPHGPRGGRGPMGPPPIIALLDQDQDHVISEVEIANAGARLLTLDANKDGQLAFEELCPRPPGAPAGVGPDANKPLPPQQGAPGKGKRFGGGKGPMGPPPIMQALDTDGDKVLSSAEIQGSPAALATLDTNQDKQLTPDELRPRDGRGGPGRPNCPPSAGQQ